MIRIATVIGARPQFVKAAVVSSALAESGGAREFLIHTGQHYDDRMSAIFFEELGLRRPDVELAVGSGAHGAQTGRMLEAIEAVLLREKPDWLLVYGDTNSTVAGALAAAKLHIPVAHVESGLRSFNRRMPEEINRVITDHISEKLFAPTHAAVNHLEAEGIPADKVRMVGDVMYDVALQYGAIAEERSSILDRLNLRPKAYVLSTIHRAENTDDPERLKLLFEAIRHVSERVPVVLPLHPRTKCAVMAAGVPLAGSPGLIVTDPLGYLDMAMLERNASVIATDSGGVQKEAFFYQVPCVTLRLETEWAELIDLGWNRLATGASSVEIATSILGAVGTRGLAGSPYGSGRAACAIAADLTGMALNTESRSHEYPSH